MVHRLHQQALVQHVRQLDGPARAVEIDGLASRRGRGRGRGGIVGDQHLSVLKDMGEEFLQYGSVRSDRDLRKPVGDVDDELQSLQGVVVVECLHDSEDGVDEQGGVLLLVCVEVVQSLRLDVEMDGEGHDSS